MTRRPFLPSLALGVGAFLLANAAESALITATGGNPWPVAWTSEVVLSAALVVTTYLWLHVGSLKAELSTLERSRLEIESELRVAASIQRHLLQVPGTRPCPVSWYGLLEPARQVGGDFFDVLNLPDGSVLILTADVSGKGIPGAIALAGARALFREIAPHAPDLPTLACALSRAIHADNGGTPYMTAILCQVDPIEDELRYVNAGHPPGRLVGPWKLVHLPPTGPPLGLFPDSRWEQVSLDAAGFTLGLFLTDGVLEALEGKGDPDAILDDLARRLAGVAPESACAVVMERVRAARESAEAPPDDRTVLAFVPSGHRG